MESHVLQKKNAKHFESKIFCLNVAFVFFAFCILSNQKNFVLMSRIIKFQLVSTPFPNVLLYAYCNF